MKVFRHPKWFRQRNRRLLITVLMAFILIAALSMLYLGYEVVKIPMQKDDFIEKEQISVLEERLQKLEKEIRKNRQYLNQLSFSERQETKPEKATLNVVNWHKSTANSTPFIPSDLVLTCPFDSSPMVAKADLQVPDIYSEIEFDNVDGGVWKQGFPITYDANRWSSDNKLQVFVVPHSHNDPGWIKTFEAYYLDQTRHIFNNLVAKLKEDHKRKMIWAEVSYLALWWERANEKDRKEMNRLIRNGQLEIVTGGWVMNDEAVAHYFAIIEQLMEGHEWLENHLNYHPENGWAIDPFGLSPTMAYLLKRMGLNHMVIQRVHYSIKKYFSKSRSLEFYWRQAWDQANVTDIFCHLMPFYSYDIPHTCGPDPKICCQFDFKRLPGGKISCPWKIAPKPITPENVAEKAALLLDQYRKKAQLYRSNVVLIPLGDDFRYDKLIEWDQQYLNYQALFNYMNSNPKWNVKAQFGTLRDYFNAVQESLARKVIEDSDKHIPSFTGDFFTYADRDDHYWSGYYSSRPLYKNMDRVLESYLRAGEIIFSCALARLSQTSFSQKYSVDDMMLQIVNARRNLGLFQHHDAVSGTAKDPVVIDYGKRLLQSITNMQSVIGKSAALLLSPPGAEMESSSVMFDLDDNRASHSSISKKTVIEVSTEGNKVVFYNSLGHRREELVTLWVSAPHLCVLNSARSVIVSQISPVWHEHELVDDKFELSFVVEVPPLGLSTYVLELATPETSCVNKSEIIIYNMDTLPQTTLWNVKFGEPSDISIRNSELEAAFSTTDGLLKSLTNFNYNHTETVEVSFLMYGTTHKKDKSGAYLFLPDGEATPIEYEPPYFRVSKGVLSSEVRTFLPYVEHSVQLRKTTRSESVGLYVSNIVDITQELNKELVMRLKTGISNFKTFYTDLNGFQMMRRVKLDKLPLQGNFYPVSSAMYIEDKSTRFTVLNGQSLGGASLEPGWMELILDRRLNQDDNRGLQQPMLDNKITPSSFVFLMEKRQPNNKASTQTPGLLSLSANHLSLYLMYPVLRLIDVTPSQSSVAQSLISNFSALGAEFPCDMHILNLRTSALEVMNGHNPVVSVKNNSLLLIHHLGFDCNIYSPPLTCSLSNDQINIERLFDSLFQANVKEVTLTGLYDFDKFPKSKTVLIPPMEINAYKLFR